MGTNTSNIYKCICIFILLSLAQKCACINLKVHLPWICACTYTIYDIQLFFCTFLRKTFFLFENNNILLVSIRHTELLSLLISS